MRSHLLHDLFTIVMFAVVGSKAAITTAGCSGNSCIQFKQGHACYYNPTPTPCFSRTTACAHPRMTTILDQHMESPPPNASALAYYHLDDNSFLGGADLSLTEHAIALSSSDIAICFTGGIAGTWLFLSTCRLARGDNDHTGRDVDAGCDCGRVHTFAAGVVQEVCSSSPTYDWERYLRSYRLLYLGF